MNSRTSWLGIFFFTILVVSFMPVTAYENDSGSNSDSQRIKMDTVTQKSVPEHQDWAKSIEKTEQQPSELSPSSEASPPTNAIPDPEGYRTVTYFKNQTNWSEAQKEILPFSERYRTTSDLSDWASTYPTNPDLPVNYQNESIPKGESFFTNESTDFTETLEFIPGFTVAVTVEVNDTNSAGDVDLFVYNSLGVLLGSSEQTNSTEIVQFVPEDESEHVVEVRHITESVFNSTNMTLTIDQEVNTTRYGMTPGYVPINELIYENGNIPRGTSLWTNETGDFPHVLRFIEGYPVIISLDVDNTTVAGEIDLFVYNSTGFVALSTNNLPTLDSVTFVPTSEDVHAVEIRHRSDSSNTSTYAILSIKQIVSPQLVIPYLGDSGTTRDKFAWYFDQPFVSFGLNTPESLDLDKVEAFDSDTENDIQPYTFGDFEGFGVNYVYDNETWADTDDMHFRISSTVSCDTITMTTPDRCNSFLPIYFYQGDYANLATTGMWVPSLNENPTLGANPQVLSFQIYSGEQGLSNQPTQVRLLDAGNNIVQDLTVGFTLETVNSFVSLLTLPFDTTSLDSGSYKIVFLGDTEEEFYEYPLTIDSENYFGNYHPAQAQVGFEETSDGKTLVFAKTFDPDTTVTQLLFNYTTDGSTWTEALPMEWLEPNKYGFVVQDTPENLANWSIGVYESAPLDVGKTRLKIRGEFSNNEINLMEKNNVTLTVSVTVYGMSVENLTLNFTNANNYLLINNSDSLTKLDATYTYFVNQAISILSTIERELVFIPKNPHSEPLEFVVWTLMDGTYETCPKSIEVSGGDAPEPVVDVKGMATGELSPIYLFVDDSYSLTFNLSFNGATPKGSLSATLRTMMNSLTETSHIISTSNIFPGIAHTYTLTALVDRSFVEPNDDIELIITFDGSETPFGPYNVEVVQPEVELNLVEENGNPIETIYTSLYNSLTVMAEITFINGTPKETAILQLTAASNVIEEASEQLNISEITAGVKHMFMLTSSVLGEGNAENDQLTLSLVYDDRTFSESYEVEVDNSPLNDIYRLELQNSPILPNSTNPFEVELELGLTLTKNVSERDVTIVIEEVGSDFTAIEKVISDLEVSTTKTFIMSLNFGSGFVPNSETYLITFNIIISESLEFTQNVDLSTDYQPSEDSNPTQTTGSDDKTPTKSQPSTPGFEALLLIAVLPIVFCIRKLKQY